MSTDQPETFPRLTRHEHRDRAEQIIATADYIYTAFNTSYGPDGVDRYKHAAAISEINALATLAVAHLKFADL